jgi:hypothetical protein
MNITSSYGYSGDMTATINSLTNASPTTTLTIADLSENDAQNQQIFMNQPMSWWVECLNNSSIGYTPISGEINWSFGQYPIYRTVTDLIIPNRNVTVTHDTSSNAMILTFEPKLGMTRQEIRDNHLRP